MLLHESSRNGPVLVIDEPVTIILSHPWERVNFCPIRDANPFFHLIEGLAMLGNVNDVEILSRFAKRMYDFSDDGKTYNAFYGTRARAWKLHDGNLLDQLHWVIGTLKTDKTSRQAVVQLWDPVDLQLPTKDKACNLCMLFYVRENQLCMTTFNRSNDAVLGGVSGANIVHLSMFQEYVATCVGLPMGRWCHVSNNLHVYIEDKKTQEVLQGYKNSGEDPYSEKTAIPSYMCCHIGEVTLFMHEIRTFFNILKEYKKGYCINADHFATPFFRRVVIVLFNAWVLHRDMHLTKQARDTIPGNYYENGQSPVLDWHLAAYNWLGRRLDNR
jgi:hypothetical protein